MSDWSAMKMALLFVRLLNLFTIVCSCRAAHLTPDIGELTNSIAEKNFHSYWMAFINVTYVDKESNVLRSERTETGRFSNGGRRANVPPREASGFAAEVVSASDPDDHTGCDPPFKPITLKDPWIAVVKRGKCTFNQKIANVQELNASGVIVFDDQDGNVLQTMKVESFEIPSVFTFRWKGIELLELIRSQKHVFVTLQPSSQCFSKKQYPSQETDGNEDVVNHTASSTLLYCAPTKSDIKEHYFAHIFRTKQAGSGASLWDWSIASSSGRNLDNNSYPSLSEGSTFNVEKRTSVLFVSVSFVVLMIISLAWLVFYYVQRFRYLHAKDRLERKLCNQAKRALSIISTSVLKKDDLEMKDFSETCAVCIETYRVADVVRILPCKHQFHKSCIDQWLLEKRTCPMCKMDILKHYGLIGDDDDERTSRSSNRRTRRNNRNEVVVHEDDEEIGEDAVISLA